MEAPKRREWALFRGALLLAITTVVVLIFAIGAVRHRTLWTRLFDRVQLLAGSRSTSDEIDSSLREAAHYAKNPREWQQILQYAWKNGSSREVLYEIAESAYSQHAEVDLFRYVLQYACLATGKTERAAELVVTDPTSDLAAELAFLAGPIPPDMSNDHLSTLRAARSADPAATYAVAEYYNDQRLYENAALLAAFADNRTLAATATATGKLVDSRATDVHSGYIRLLLAAWTADEDALFSQLRRLDPSAAVESTTLLVQADAYLRQNQLELADAIYREVIATDPRFSLTPYLNHSLILSRTGNDDGALEATGEAMTVFPDEPLVLVRRVADLERLGRRPEASKLLQTIDYQSLFAKLPSEYHSQIHHLWLLAHAYNTSREPAARFESELWRYLNRYPEADEVASFLLAYLRFRNDEQGIEDLLSRYVHSDATWVVGMRAIVASEQHRYSDADLLFSDVSTRTQMWEHLYDAALFAALHYLDTDRSQAVDRLYQRAVRLDIPDSGKAAFIMLRAEMARLSGYLDRAEDLAVRATEISPNEESYRTFATTVAGE